MPKALIIDDEPPACEALRALLADHPHIAITGEAGTMTEGRAVLAGNDYDLVFLDVQLRGGSGFDLVPHVRPRARIIFVTSYDQHALRAFEVNALDFLLKPVAPERLERTLQRVAEMASSEEPAVEPALPVFAPQDLVHLKLNAHSTRFVALAQIAAVRSCENYSEVHLADSSRHFVRHTMKAWEERLPRTHFARVHRNVIIGLTHYRGVDYVPEGTSRLHLAGVLEPLPASYRYWPECCARLAALGIPQ
jgi:two-component system, LytTR family, response regulator